MDISPSERARIDNILKLMKNRGINIDDLSYEGYPAVAIHSNSIVVAANAAAEAIFGYEPGGITYVNAWTLFPAESGAALLQHLLEHSEEPYQVAALRRDGKKIRVELKGQEIMLENDLLRVIAIKQID